MITFDAKLNALENPAVDADGTIVSALSAKKDVVTSIAEVSLTYVDVKASSTIVNWEKDQTADRSTRSSARTNCFEE